MVIDVLEIYKKALTSKITEEEADRLTEIKRKYPYFALPYYVDARASLTKENLFIASTYSPNRGILKQYIDGTVFLPLLETNQSLSDNIYTGRDNPYNNELFTILTTETLAYAETYTQHTEGLLTTSTTYTSKGGDEFLHTSIQLNTILHLELEHKIRKEITAFVIAHPASEAELLTLDETTFEEIDLSSIQEEVANMQNGISSKLEAVAVDEGSVYTDNKVLYVKDNHLIEVPVSKEDYAKYFNPQKATAPQKVEIAPQSDSDINTLINKFLTFNPKKKRSPNDPEVPADEKTADSIVKDEEIISETLARLHIKQGNHKEAIHIYERLSLLFPEKNDYFVAQITKLKKT